MSFDLFAFCDNGSNLTLQYLVTHGYRAGVDFGYNYGLLPLLLGKFWFGLFGLTPVAYQFAIVACGVVGVWAITRILIEQRVCAIGIALVFVTIGFAIQSNYLSLSQPVEAVLILFALLWQSRGSYRIALIFSAAAVFSKPSMGYLYSVLLVLLIGIRIFRTKAGFKRWAFELGPAAILFVILCLLLGLAYGFRSLLTTVLPLQGASNYKAANFGFFKAGRQFWDTVGVPWWEHLLSVSGFWVFSSIVLSVFAFSAVVKLAREDDWSGSDSQRQVLIVTCALLHLSFVLLFFGSSSSWTYYSYLLVLGVALALKAGPVRRDLGLALCAVALLSWTADIVAIFHRWERTHYSPIADGLWLPAGEEAEWSAILALPSSDKAILDINGNAELMFAGFGSPTTVYLNPGLMRESEVEFKKKQLSHADYIVEPAAFSACNGPPQGPVFDDTIKSFAPKWNGHYFKVLEKRRDSAHKQIR